MIGTDDACVEGCESKKSAKSQHARTQSVFALTKHVSRSRLKPKDFLVLQCVTQSHEKTRAPFQTIDDVGISDLESSRKDTDVEPFQACAIDLARLVGVAAESSSLEHLQAGYRQSLTPAVNLARLFAAVLPLCACASVQKYGNEEKVHQATRSLLIIDGRRPRGHQLIDTRPATHIEMLPPAVGGNGSVVRCIVALVKLLASRIGANRYLFLSC